jgi:hypothetical protein
MGATLHVHVIPHCPTVILSNQNACRSPKGVKRDRPSDSFNLFSPPAPPNQKRK